MRYDIIFLVNNLRPVERAYIAGFFDGEGCVHFMKNRGGKPRVSLTQKDPEVLHKIQGLLGCGGISPQGEYWQFQVYSLDDTWDFVNLILKYSVVKRKILLEARRRLKTHRAKGRW